VPHLVVETLYDPAHRRRVLIFKRPDETFGFEEQYYSDVPAEKSWIPVAAQFATRVGTAADAEREARGRVSWLSGAGQ
jgi:hypothetical protein